MNNNNKTIISEQEITLAPERKLKVINNDTGTKKYPMILEYSKPGDKQKLMQVLCELKCPIIETIDFAKCIVTDLTKSEIKKIKEYDFIETIERNYKYDLLAIDDGHKNDVHSENYNITHKSLEVLKAHEKTKNKVKVAIFDTGIDMHPELNIAGGVCFVGTGKTYTDTDGHGTKMAGIIASAENKEADTKYIDLYAVKIFDDTGHATTASIIRAINWAVENKVDIINMSFGTYYPSKIFKKYIDMATDNGIIIVAAVGNDGGFKDRHRIMYPAKYDNVIAVGSGNASGISAFSNNSIDLDFVAPGTAISTDVNGGYTNITGTSVSCAYITSMLAALWSINRDIDLADIISAAKSSGKVQDAGTSYVGYGEIDAKAALTKIGTNGIMKTDKSDIYSVDMLSSVSDIYPSSVAARSASYYPCSNCGSNICGSGSNICDSGSNICDSDSNICNCDSNICGDYIYSAIPLNLSEYKDISYSRLKRGVWYKFTADELDAHPGIGPGFYHIYTYGISDTIGELYDSTGNLIAHDEENVTNSWRGFEIYAELEYAKTYYVYVKEKNLAGGSVSIIVEPVTDDHGNSRSSATYLGDVYSQNFSVTGFLHNAIDYYRNGDIDYFYFRSTKDCVVEIFSEGSSEIYGTVYDANGVSVNLDSFNMENDDIKLTCHIESNKLYYIEISRCNNLGYATDYTLNVKFLKDFYFISDSFYSYINKSIVAWYNNSYTSMPVFPQEESLKYHIFMNRESARIWKNDYLNDSSFAEALLSIASGSFEDLNEIIDVFSDFDINVNIETSFAASIIINFLCYLIAPLINEIMFNSEFNTMNENHFMDVELWTVGECNIFDVAFGEQANYEYTHYYVFKHSSGEYLYGHDYLKGIWEKIEL